MQENLELLQVLGQDAPLTFLNPARHAMLIPGDSSQLQLQLSAAKIPTKIDQLLLDIY